MSSEARDYAVPAFEADCPVVAEDPPTLPVLAPDTAISYLQAASSIFRLGETAARPHIGLAKHNLHVSIPSAMTFYCSPWPGDYVDVVMFGSQTTVVSDVYRQRVLHDDQHELRNA